MVALRAWWVACGLAAGAAVLGAWSCGGSDATGAGGAGGGECRVGELQACWEAAWAAKLGFGLCHAGVRKCVAGAWSDACLGAVGPAQTDSCGDGLDNDCDGAIDAGCDCATPAATQPCA